MQLTKRTRLERHNRGSNSGGDWEVLGVHNGDVAATAGDGDARRRRRVVEDVRAGASEPAVGSAVLARRRRGVEDVWVLVGDIIKDGDIDAKVLGEDVTGGVRNPVVDHESRSEGVKVAWVC